MKKKVWREKRAKREKGERILLALAEAEATIIMEIEEEAKPKKRASKKKEA